METDNNIKNMLLSIPETAEQPSSAVWEGVQRGLNRRDFWRVKGKVLLLVSFLVVLSGILLFPVSKEKSSEKIICATETKVEVAAQEILPLLPSAVPEQTAATTVTELPVVSMNPVVSADISERPVEKTEEAVSAVRETLHLSMSEKVEVVVPGNPEVKASAVSQPSVPAAVSAKKTETAVPEAVRTLEKTVEAPSFRVIFPSAFTPNGDGLNDTYNPRISEQVSQYTMRIYNRNNQLVFQTLHPEESWDGTFRGQPQPHGAYVCLISCVTASGKHSSKSEFLLLRD